MADDATMTRLEEQIRWYDRKSRSSQHCYKGLKVVVLIVAALIPLLSGLQMSAFGMPVSPLVLGAMGAAIAVIEGIQQVFQFHGNWISYRSTCEALKHEKYLYLGKAGPYAAAGDAARALLAELVESLVSQETAKWASAQEIANRRAVQPRDTDGGGGATGTEAGKGW